MLKDVPNMSKTPLFTNEDLSEEIDRLKDEMQSLEKENDELRAGFRTLSDALDELESSSDNAFSVAKSERRRLARKLGLD